MLLSTIVVIIVYTIVPINLSIEKVASPSMKHYEVLNAEYESTLRCPCTRSQIPHKSFLTVNVTFHQICSSDLVKEPWLLYLAQGFNSTILARSDFLVTASANFQLLSTLCDFAKTTTQNSINGFLNESFVTAEMVSNTRFLSEIDDETNQLKVKTTLLLSLSVQLLRGFVRSDAYMSSYALNWYFWMKNLQSFEIFSSSPIIINGECSCGSDKYCVDRNIFSSLVPGWVLGCSIVDTLLGSSLEAFYNQTWLDDLMKYINKNPQISFQILNATAMDDSLTSRFQKNATIQSIFDELFAEQWSFNITYSDFYEQCAPMYCQYSFDSRRNAINIVSKILGLYGGLTVSLRFFVPNIVALYYKAKSCTRFN